MGRLFLCSSVADVGGEVVGELSKLFDKPLSDLKVAFITTAAEGENPDDMDWIMDDRNGLTSAGLKVFDYTITGKGMSDFESDLSDCDVIHVNGGNTFYLLLQMKKTGFDLFIRKFVDKGGFYIGSSAGSMVASPDIYVARKIETKTFEGELPDFKGLGLVNFIIFPHIGSEYFRDIYLKSRFENAYNEDGNIIILLRDSQFVIVEDDMYRVVDTRN